MSDDVNAAPEGGEEKVLSLADDLSKTWDAMEKADAPPVESKEPETPEPEAPKSDRPRGPDGKFIKADDAPKEEAPAKPEITDQGAKAPAEPVATQAIEPPASWSAVAKAKWRELPPDIQQEVLKREGDFTKGLEQRTAKLKSYEPIDQALEPIRRTLELNGVEPATYVRQLVAADQLLRTQPKEAIQWIARQYGIDLHAVTQAAPQGDPQLAPLQAEIQDLRQKISAYEQQQQNAEKQAITNQLDTFRNETDAQGQPKHPHFETVRVEMGALMNAALARGESLTMEKAYEMAVWARPDLRQSLLTAQQQAAEQKRVADLKAKAAAASKASGLDVTGKGGGSPAKPKTLAEELSDTWDRLAS